MGGIWKEPLPYAKHTSSSGLSKNLTRPHLPIHPKTAEPQRARRKSKAKYSRHRKPLSSYPKRQLSQPGEGHRIYPYLLEGLEITGPDQVWCSDITYVPMARGYMYLVAVMDWWSRYVLAWELSNSLD